MEILTFNHNIKSSRLKKYITEKLKYSFSCILKIMWMEEYVEISIESKHNDIQLKDYIQKIISDCEELDRFTRNKVNTIDVNIIDNNILINQLLKDKFSKLIHSLDDNEEFSEGIILSDKGVKQYIGNAKVLRDELNYVLTDIANKLYNAKSLNSTNILSHDIVKRCGYINSNAQNLLLLYKYKSVYTDSEEYLEEILTPAVCLNTYHWLENKKLDFEKKGYYCVDIHGNAYRNEGNQLNSTYRLKEFSVHEFVFFADEVVLEKISSELLNLMYSILEFFKIFKNFEYANDIFFGKDENSQLFNQLISDSKIEAISNKNEISIGSLNKHKSKFTKEFNITSINNNKLNSLCLAFGIDRIVHEVSEKFSIKEFKKEVLS